MDQTKDVFRKVVIDSLLLLGVGVPILILYFTVEPYDRGFFCGDESLMHPYHENTVTMTMLVSLGISIPLAFILIVELVRGKLNLDDERQLKLFNWNVPVCIKNLYKYIGMFSFGAACCQLTTDIAKYSIGRLRPHFISVCQPILSDGTDCKNLINLHRYVEEFTCSNSEATDKALKDMRLSFPSANSSFSFYTMVFCAIYLHSRLSWKGSKLYKYFLQFVFLMMAWFTSLSRISDYKHHWSDVLAGAVLGIFFAVIINCYIKLLRTPESCDDKLPEIKYELNPKNTNGSNS